MAHFLDGASPTSTYRPPGIRTQTRSINPERRLISQVRRALACDIPATIVASIGRSGSTLVYDAIVNGIAASRFPYFRRLGRRIVCEEAWNLDSTVIENGAVYKTHDFPYGIAPGRRIKAVFLYRRPSDTILSLYQCRERNGRDWIDEHFAHLHANGRFEDILDRDVLRYEEQISSWSNADNVDVLGLRYETLWDHAERINAFLGLEVPLPRYLAPRREEDYDARLVARVRDAYGPLDEIVAEMPDYFVSGPSFHQQDSAPADSERFLNTSWSSQHRGSHNATGAVVHSGHD